MAQSISAPIERVLVGRSYAEITRAAKLDADALPRSIEIGGLPLALEDGSVRVRIEGGDLEARALRVALVAKDEPAGEAPDERAVLDAEREVGRIRRALDASRASLERLRAVGVRPRPPGSKKEGPPKAPVAERIELAAFVRARGDKLMHEIFDAEKALRLAEEKLAAAVEARRKSSSDRPLKRDELRKAIVVDLERVARKAENAATEGTRASRLVVSYVVPGARWMPEYTLRIDGGRADLEIRAVLQQKTGEDWTGVALALSTARAEKRGDIPELATLRIGRAQRPARRGYRAAPEGAGALYDDYSRAKQRALDASRPEPHRADETVTRAATVTAEPEEAGELEEQSAFAAHAELLEDAPEFAAPQAQGHAPPRGGAAPMPERREQTARLAKADRAGAPPRPYGAAVAMSAPMTRTAAAKKSAGFGLGALAAGATALFDGAGGPAPRRAVTDERAASLELELELGAESLAYGRMRMSGPDDPSRGTLKPLADAELYLEARAEVRALVRTDIARAIADAAREADSLIHAPPPSNHVPAEGHDGFDFAFSAEAPVDVASDGEPHATLVTRMAAPIELFHVAVPRESRSAFRCAEMESPLASPLLTGPLDVYEGKDFLLSTRLPTTPPRGKIVLGLGVDAAIKIARNFDFAETVTGLMRGSLDLRHQISIEISNPKKEPLRIDVRERVPVVREKEEDIKVDVLAVEPRWAAYEDDEHRVKGAYVWHVTVPPGEKKKLTAEYVVRIASKHELVGGNRRES